VVVNESKQNRVFVRSLSNNKNRTAAAITEAVLIIPVLLVILFTTYQIYKASLLAANAAVAARTEIMLDSVAMNNNIWKPFRKQERTEDATLFKTSGFFPNAGDVQISTGLSRSNKSWLEKLASILTGSSVVNVKFKIEKDILAKNILGREITNSSYVYSATCATDPWALNPKRFFGFLDELLTQTNQNTGLLENETNYESIPKDDD
jgi:hypothetical protein